MAAEAAVRAYMVKELGRREVEEVNRPELTHRSSRNVLAMLGLICLCAALNACVTA